MIHLPFLSDGDMTSVRATQLDTSDVTTGCILRRAGETDGELIQVQRVLDNGVDLRRAYGGTARQRQEEGDWEVIARPLHLNRYDADVDEWYADLGEQS